MMRRALPGTAAAAAVMMAASSGRARAEPSDDDGLSGAQRLEVLEMIEAYLLNNPDVLVKSLARSGLSASVTVDQAIAKASRAARAAFADPSQGHCVAAGNTSGGASLVVAFDYACPFCRALAPLLEKTLAGRPDLRMLLRETPILTTESRQAAAVGVAVAAQSAAVYVKYHFRLMRRRGPLTEQSIMDAASAAGANLALAASEAGSPVTTAALDANKGLLKGIGALATPMLESGGRLETGMLSAVELEGFIRGTPGIGK